MYFHKVHLLVGACASADYRFISGCLATADNFSAASNGGWQTLRHSIIRVSPEISSVTARQQTLSVPRGCNLSTRGEISM